MLLSVELENVKCKRTNNLKCQFDATRKFIVVSLARHVSGAYAHHQ